MSKNKDGDAVGVTEYDDNYIGASPEYQNSAYLANAPVSDEDAEDPTATRVAEHLASMEAPGPNTKSFEDYVGDRGKPFVPGVRDVRTEAEKKADEKAEKAKEKADAEAAADDAGAKTEGKTPSGQS